LAPVALVGLSCDSPASSKPTAVGTVWTFTGSQLGQSGPSLDPEVEKSWMCQSDTSFFRFGDDKARVRITARFAHAEVVWPPNTNTKMRMAAVRSLRVEVLENPRGLHVEPFGITGTGHWPAGTVLSGAGRVPYRFAETTQALSFKLKWSGEYLNGCRREQGPIYVSFQLGGDQRFHSVASGTVTPL
jgi:hypothetical protein